MHWAYVLPGNSYPFFTIEIIATEMGSKYNACACVGAPILVSVLYTDIGKQPGHDGLPVMAAILHPPDVQ